MTDKISLGERMKTYEATTQITLLRRMPVIIRIDGRAFHTFTRHIKPEKSAENDNVYVDVSLKETPFSVKLHQAMLATAATLFKEVQNTVFVYTQSDEISILLKDWEQLETQQWFGANVQKMVSLSSSIATAAFNFAFHNIFNSWPTQVKTLAHFDSRVFNLPKEEVTNYFIWRQQDALRNSVQMLGRFVFSQKEMHGKHNDKILDMLMQKNINWNSLPTWMKRGSCVIQKPIWDPVQPFLPLNCDEEIPIFTQSREYIESRI